MSLEVFPLPRFATGVYVELVLFFSLNVGRFHQRGHGLETLSRQQTGAIAEAASWFSASQRPLSSWPNVQNLRNHCFVNFVSFFFSVVSSGRVNLVLLCHLVLNWVSEI